MKFAQQLEEYKIEQWKDHYIPYALLKKRLEDIKSQMYSPGSPDASIVPSTPSSLGETASWTASSPPHSPSMPPSSLLGSWKRRTFDHSLEGGSPEEVWCTMLEQHARHAGDFVQKGIEGLRKQLAELSKLGEKFAPCCSQDDKHYDELRFLEALALVKEGVGRLKSFAEINHAALFKILKKHDKQLSVDYGIKSLFPRLVAESQLANTAPFDELDGEVQTLSALTSQCEGLDASLEVANLAAGLGRNAQGGSISSPSQIRGDNLLFFFLGSTVALFLSIAVFIALPPTHPESFDIPYFLSPFPVFEVVLAIALTLWGLGFVARSCDDKNINYKFLLNVDPRSRVQPGFYFSRAAVLTSSWILIFGMYVLDYKWMIFPTIDADRGYNSRSSLHFVFYPALMVIVAVLVVFGPSKFCLCKYWLEFVRTLGRTSLAPLYTVSFMDNLVGDVLTSLSKPLQIVPSAYCYFVSAHPQTQRSVARFVEHGSLCPKWEHAFVNPFIAALPFIFRALQCLRRWHDTHQSKHLWNFGKYMASLLVVFVSAFLSDSPAIVVCVSGLATAYAATWDIGLDWGLTFHDLMSCGKSTSTFIGGASRAELPGGSRSELPDANNRVDRHYKPITYWLAAVFDILARLSWIQTLMPSDILTDSIIMREALIVSTLALEIMRRSIWAVLRIEYEQVSNAGGFRTLLWVPSKLNATATLPSLELLTPIDRECHTVFEGNVLTTLREGSGGSSQSLGEPSTSTNTAQPLLGGEP